MTRSQLIALIAGLIYSSHSKELNIAQCVMKAHQIVSETEDPTISA